MAKDKICKQFAGIISPENKLTVNTIEDMQSRKYLKIGDIVELNGYYTAGDGAHHKRKIESADDGSGVQLANGLWANIVHSGEVNVSWFGAKGDGVADDTSAIQKALVFCGNINLDYKIFKTSKVITSTSNKTSIKNGKFVIETEGLKLESTEAELYNLIIVQTKENFSEYLHSILAINSDLKISNSKILGFRGDGIYFSSSGKELNVENCIFDGINRENRNAISSISCKKINIKNTKFYNCTRDNMPGAIDIEPNNSSENIPNIYIYNCEFIGNRIGFVYQNRYVSSEGFEKNININSCIFENNKFSDIVIEEDYLELDVNIEGNSMKNGGNWANHSGSLRFMGHNSNLVFSNNTIKNCGNSAILLSSKGSIINGNKFINTNTNPNTENQGAITRWGNSFEHNIISNNYFENVGRENANGFVLNFYSNLEILGSTVFTGNIINRTQKQTTLNRAIFASVGAKVVEENNFIDKQDKVIGTVGITKIFTQNISSGTIYPTSKRVGEQFFNTQTYKPMWWSGSAWRDAVGANSFGVELLNTPYHTLKMQQEGVYEDFIQYMDAKTAYDLQQRELEQQRQLEFEQRENQEQTYEEWLAEQPMMLPVENEPQPSEALLKFKEKYLG